MRLVAFVVFCYFVIVVPSTSLAVNIFLMALDQMTLIYMLFLAMLDIPVRTERTSRLGNLLGDFDNELLLSSFKSTESTEY